MTGIGSVKTYGRMKKRNPRPLKYQRKPAGTFSFAKKAAHPLGCMYKGTLYVYCYFPERLQARNKWWRLGFGGWEFTEEMRQADIALAEHKNQKFVA